MSLQTTVGIAKIGTKSLRVTIPEGIVVFLDVGDGDKLEWRMEIQDGERITTVRKVKAEGIRIAEKYLKGKQGRKS